MAEELVLSSMFKWKKLALTPQNTKSLANDDTINSDDTSQSARLTSENIESGNCEIVPSVAREVEIDSCNKLDDSNSAFTRSSETKHVSDSYNGAIRENYVWTQTLSDLDVLVKIPEYVKIMKNALRVDVSSDEIKIDVRSPDPTRDSEWDSIFSGKLSFKIRKNETVWSIVSGKHISVRFTNRHKIEPF